MPPSRGGGSGTRSERQELAPSLSWVPSPTTGHLEALVPGEKGGEEVAQQCHQFLPLA